MAPGTSPKALICQRPSGTDPSRPRRIDPPRRSGAGRAHAVSAVFSSLGSPRLPAVGTAHSRAITAPSRTATVVPATAPLARSVPVATSCTTSGSTTWVATGAPVPATGSTRVLVGQRAETTRACAATARARRRSHPDAPVSLGARRRTAGVPLSPRQEALSEGQRRDLADRAHPSFRRGVTASCA